MIIERLGLIDRNQKGFTIVELLIAFIVAALVAIAVITGVFQIVTGNVRTSNHMTAVRQVQEAGYWVSHDAQMAQDVNTDNSSSPIILELTWYEWDTSNKNHVIYSLQNMPVGGLKQLERQHIVTDTDGVEVATGSIIAHYIDDSSNPPLTSCHVTDGVIIFKITATVGSDSQRESETRIYEITPRPTL